MADRSFFKEKLRYHRVLVICIVVISIWLQYNFSSDNLSYENGQAKIEGENINGKDEGLWRWYYSNGKKQMEGRFINGKRNGIWTVWNSSGVKISESNYIDDKLNGAFTNYNDKGEVIRSGNYIDDKISQLEKRKK